MICSLNESMISVVVCKSNQNCSFAANGSDEGKPRLPPTPCIRRCCDFGQVYDLSGLGQTPARPGQCKPSGDKQWTLSLYNKDPYTRLNEQQMDQVRPHYMTSHP